MVFARFSLRIAGGCSVQAVYCTQVCCFDNKTGPLSLSQLVGVRVLLTRCRFPLVITHSFPLFLKQPLHQTGLVQRRMAGNGKVTFSVLTYFKERKSILKRQSTGRINFINKNDHRKRASVCVRARVAATRALVIIED